MADRRHQIAALRAKAASTTFPAEAEACRAKADELEALEPKRATSGIGAVDDFMRRYEHVYEETTARPSASQWDYLRARPGDLWDAAGGITVIQVTTTAGESYTIWVTG